MQKERPTQSKGVLLALLAYFIWSCFPFYFKLLDAYHAIEIIVHRIIWTLLALSLVLIAFRRFAWIAILKKEPKWLFLTLLSGLLIATNWLSYVYMVNHDRILEASLGYFISPLMGVALSFLVFKERLRPLQWLALALASLAVIIQMIWLGVFPVMAFVLAISFSVYGVMQRKTPLDALSALFLETVLLTPFCLIWLATHQVASSHWQFWVSGDIWLLMLAGPVTLIPLLLYNSATKLIGFNILSFLQYLTPSAIFIIAVFYYKESFDMQQLFIFGLIWLALALFTVDMVRKHKVQPPSNA